MTSFASIVVVNWNGRHHLQTCLSSLLGQTYPNFEVILVDNGSSDGSVPYVHEHFPQVRLIGLQQNVGFAAGNNVGILASQADYVATVNNDTKVDPNWLTALVETAESDPAVGMCASKLLFYDRPQIINSAGICLDQAGIAWDRHGGEPNVAEAQPPQPVFGPSAGAALYRRTMLDEIGLFDEDFFAYLEDVDLAWRARLAGWHCLYVDTAVVHHRHSATAVEGSPFKSRLLGRNKIWTILKNYPGPAQLLYWPLILAYDWGSTLLALLLRRDANPLIGRLLALPGLPRVWRQRRQIQKQRRLSIRDALALMESIAAPHKVWQRYIHLRT